MNSTPRISDPTKFEFSVLPEGTRTSSFWSPAQIEGPIGTIAVTSGT